MWKGVGQMRLRGCSVWPTQNFSIMSCSPSKCRLTSVERCGKVWQGMGRECLQGCCARPTEITLLSPAWTLYVMKIG